MIYDKKIKEMYLYNTCTFLDNLDQERLSFSLVTFMNDYYELFELRL